jgi:hypothetical protein
LRQQKNGKNQNIFAEILLLLRVFVDCIEFFAPDFLLPQRHLLFFAGGEVCGAGFTGQITLNHRR